MARLAARQWAVLIEKQAASGQSTAEFALSHGVNPRTLSWWRWRLRKARQPRPVPASPFVELEVCDGGDEAVVEATGLTVELETIGACINVTERTDLGLLRRVAEALC